MFGQRIQLKSVPDYCLLYLGVRGVVALKSCIVTYLVNKVFGRIHFGEVVQRVVEIFLTGGLHTADSLGALILSHFLIVFRGA